MNLDVQAALELPDETDAFLKISDIIFDKDASNGYTSFSEAEKAFYCIDGFIRGMGNGGVAQFFYDHGHHISDTMQALESVKAVQARRLLASALACFPGQKVPDDEHDRMNLVSDLEEENGELWSQLSDQFYDSETGLIKLTLKYVLNHLSQFT